VGSGFLATGSAANAGLATKANPSVRANKDRTDMEKLPGCDGIVIV